MKSTIGHKEFARQLAANNAPEAKLKKFRSSAAPLGTKLPSGYVDRAKKDREEAVEVSDEREARLETLRKLAEEGGIDREEYILQTKLLGGDVESTHLVKGLDFKLLEKVRRGEDVMNPTAEKVDDKVEGRDGEEDEGGEEDELDRVLNQDIAPVNKPKEEQKKKGTMALTSRDEILAELKRSREAAKPASTLGAKFKKIGVKEQKKEEVNGVRVKYVTGADGKVKKMVKKSKPDREQGPIAVSTSIMGMVPLLPSKLEKAGEEKVAEDEDMDIFEGAGTEYNPLAGLEDDDDSSSEEEGEDGEVPPTKKPKPEETAPPSSITSPSSLPSNPQPPTKRPATNYFNEPTPPAKDPTSKPSLPTASSLLSSNPDLAAALAKASTLKPLTAAPKDDAEKRRKALIEASDRDAFDIDFGFGGSRNFEDDDEDDYAGGGAGGGAKKRKRGGKGKKGGGDKNDASVVGRVVEERYGKKK